MNTTLYNLLLEDYTASNDEKVNNYFISSINKDPFKFLHEYGYIFCSYYHFKIDRCIENNKYNFKLVNWCANSKVCNCICEKYRIYDSSYRCIPNLYLLMDYMNNNLLLTLGILL